MNTQPRHPKCRALPVELHPDIQFLPLYHGGGENQRFFCLWSFLWSKPLLCRFQRLGEIPQTQASQDFAAFCLAAPRIPPRHSQTRRDTNFAIPGYSIAAIISRREGKSKIFLSVVIYVVKAAFVPFSATGGNPAIARAARLCGLLSKPRMDRVYALPKQARYQLRYTRLLSFYPAGRILPNQARYQLRYTRILNDLMGMDPPEATRRRALHTIPVHYNTPAAKREAYSYPFFFGRGLICTWTGWIN